MKKFKSFLKRIGMHNFNLAIVPILAFCYLLFSHTALAIDTGRRCCVLQVYRPEPDWSDAIEATGAVYLNQREQLFIVDDMGYVAFVDTATDHCGEWERSRSDLHAYEFRPWGERNFQGVTAVDGNEDSLLILELPEGGAPTLHSMDLGLMDITWSVDITEGPTGEFGGGITWVRDGTGEGQLFLSLTSGEIAVYRLIPSSPELTYVETISLPGMDDGAAELTALYYHVRPNRAPQLWAYFFSIDRFYVFNMDPSGNVDGTSPVESGQMLIDRGNPRQPAGIAVVDHPADVRMVRVFVANATNWAYELWWKRGGSRFAECPWHDRNLKPCCFPQGLQEEMGSCREMTRNHCSAAGGTFADDFKSWDNPRPLCVPGACDGVFPSSGCSTVGVSSSGQASFLHIVLVGLVCLMVAIRRRRGL